MSENHTSSTQPARWPLFLFYVTMIGLMVFALVGGVFSTPYFQSGHPRARDFNDRFSTADTYYTAARDMLNQAISDRVPPAELITVRKQALEYLNIALQHRTQDAYTWQLKAQQEVALNDLDAALESWRISNRFAPNDTALTGLRLRVAARLWKQMTPADQAEMHRQIRTSWKIGHGIPNIVSISVKSRKRQRIVRTAIQDIPGARDEFRDRLAIAAQQRRKQKRLP